MIFQIINGKPLVFELYAESHNERKGILEIRNRNLNFLYAPMGYVKICYLLIFKYIIILFIFLFLINLINLFSFPYKEFFNI